MTLHLLNTGYCTTHENMVLRGGSRAVVRAHALVALIEHPSGWVLFDSGYAPRVLDAFKLWPYGIYGYLTPTVLFEPVVAQLSRFGLRADDVSTVILSHLHADHVGGLLDFPKAKIVLSKACWQHAKGKSGFAALRQGVIPDLLPPDLEQRATLIEHFSHEPLGNLGTTHDLLGDGSLRLVRLEGHARGQLGLLVGKQTLLAADGCWHSRAFRQNRPPSPLPLHLFFDNAQASLQTIANLHHLHQTLPHLHIIPTHCPEVAMGLASPAINKENDHSPPPSAGEGWGGGWS